MGGSKYWPQGPVGNKDHTDASVVIIGAGISGMCMAIDLIKRNQCHNFIIVEKSSSVGGTWYDNKYPGACCDVFSMLYSYSFEQNPDWTRNYPGQEEILDYLRNVARKYNLYKYIRFNTSVDAATWDDSINRWRVDVKVMGGREAEINPEYSIECDYLISAVGQLNQPLYPGIEGMADFEGKIMHSARWDWSHSLKDQKVGIIGNGATAAQIIPEILPDTSSLTIYQRSANWVMPRGDGPVSALQRAVLKYLPPVRWRIRSAIMDFCEAFHDAITDGDSDSAGLVRTTCLEMMKAQLPNRPDLWEKITPDYKPGCKRVIISDDYYPALANEKTELDTTGIRRITKTGIEMNDGTHHEHDTIVLATGFRAVEFLHPIKITGTQGKRLGQIWANGASALYGTTVPSLPNFGMFYGPNTNLGHNSIILMIEAQSRYLNTLVGAVLDSRNRGQRIGMMPTQERTDAFNDQMQEVLKKSSFGDKSCQSWYKNAQGLITNNWSGTVVEYQEVLSKVDWEDFVVTGEKQGASASRVVFGGGKQETRIGRVREESLVSDMTLVLGALSAMAAAAFLVYMVRWF